MNYILRFLLVVVVGANFFYTQSSFCSASMSHREVEKLERAAKKLAKELENFPDFEEEAKKEQAKFNQKCLFSTTVDLHNFYKWLFVVSEQECTKYKTSYWDYNLGKQVYEDPYTAVEYEFAQPGSVPESQIYHPKVPVGLYVSDVFNLGLLTATWATEWYSYKYLLEEFTKLHVSHIISHAEQISEHLDVMAVEDIESGYVSRGTYKQLESLLYREKAFLFFSKPSKKIVMTVLGYMLIRQVVQALKSAVGIDDEALFPYILSCIDVVKNGERKSLFEMFPTTNSKDFSSKATGKVTDNVSAYMKEYWSQVYAQLQKGDVDNIQDMKDPEEHFDGLEFNLRPAPVISLMRNMPKLMLEGAINPFAWTAGFNKIFKLFFMLPQDAKNPNWIDKYCDFMLRLTDSPYYDVAKELLVFSLWVRSCDGYLINQYLFPHIKDHLEEFKGLTNRLSDFAYIKKNGVFTKEQRAEYDATKKAMEKLVRDGMQVDFFYWVGYRARSEFFWHGMINLGIGVPAYYKMFRAAYDAGFFGWIKKRVTFSI